MRSQKVVWKLIKVVTCASLKQFCHSTKELGSVLWLWKHFIVLSVYELVACDLISYDSKHSIFLGVRYISLVFHFLSLFKHAKVQNKYKMLSEKQKGKSQHCKRQLRILKLMKMSYKFSAFFRCWALYCNQLLNIAFKLKSCITVLHI